MSEAVTISEAKTHLSKLIARAERGEEVAIRRGSRVVAKIVALDPAPPRSRPAVGALRGKIWIKDDFDELGPEWDPYV